MDIFITITRFQKVNYIEGAPFQSMKRSDVKKIITNSALESGVSPDENFCTHDECLFTP